MISQLGHFLLASLLPLGGFAVLHAVRSWKTQQFSGAVLNTQRWMALINCWLIGLLFIGLVGNHFELSYVTRYSSTTLPLQYKFAALWAGMEGSLLLWSWLLSLLSLWALKLCENEEQQSLVGGFLQQIQFFFVAVMLFAADPFALLAQVPLQGKSLNPLLQNLLMCIHPPMLLTGYVSMALPAAFAFAAVVRKKMDVSWLAPARRTMLVAWLILGIGNILGSMWAYVELGWGGFWAWDPVENAAILPWFSATAFLHSIMAEKRLGIFKRWNVILAFTCFFLTIFGTYLNRSGVVQSVHAFADFTLGYWFLIYMIIFVLGIAWLMWRKREALNAAQNISSFWSRENFFLLNNIIFSLITFAVAWGTLFPVLSELIKGETISMEPQFYNKMLAPLGLILLFLTAVGPFLTWQQTDGKRLFKQLLCPVLTSCIALLCVFLFSHHATWYAYLSAALITFLLCCIFELLCGAAMNRAKARQESFFTAFRKLFSEQGSRYGAYLIHLGIACAFIAVSGTLFQKSFDVMLKKGETKSAGEYQIHFAEFTQLSDSHKDIVSAKLQILDQSGKALATMQPAYSFFRAAEQPASEIDVFVQPFKDLYIVLGSYNSLEGWAEFRILVNPLMNFLWLGGIFFIAGTFTILAQLKTAQGAPYENEE